MLKIIARNLALWRYDIEQQVENIPENSPEIMAELLTLTTPLLASISKIEIMIRPHMPLDFTAMTQEQLAASFANRAVIANHRD